MSKSSDELLAMRFGGATVAENLQRATQSGLLIEHQDGGFEPASDGGDGERADRGNELAAEQSDERNWMVVPSGPPMSCGFLMNIMFSSAYARTAVPHGCRACYKVKVAPRTLRELVAAWEIAKGIECNSKWGIDFYNSYSQDFYAGYFYTTGLDAARALFKVVREAFDADPKLGPDIPMKIKRGCSEYEAALGPSDQYEFTPEMAELEAYLKSRFRPRKRASWGNVALAYWIDAAFRIGDDSYLDFTGGKRLRQATKSYASAPDRA